ncbi:MULTISPECIES: L-serine ammonia-lyase [Corynebacterium]|uniref:L-serine ammonia-lyase n=1 Tax=Corynebacterium TaxID=1716 RepID=UPI00124C597A|nr:MULTISPECIES: L-serine ammonia-lyase [Corynebacterium]
MTISAVDLFSIGIGPSSSHTVGPMRAALQYVRQHQPRAVAITLHGSLAATGLGHGTDRATLLGLMGYEPDTVPHDIEPAPGAAIPASGTIETFDGPIDYRIVFDNAPLPQHPNGMTFQQLDASGEPLGTPQRYFSVGGGFILREEEMEEISTLPAGAATAGREGELPYPFTTGNELLELCRLHDMSVAAIMLANESQLHYEHGGAEYVLGHLDRVWHTMSECIQRGTAATGELPGGLRVRRRAAAMLERIRAEKQNDEGDALRAMEWVNLYALAVNEENAAGGRVVTAPTNGAAGIIPAVMNYARDFRVDFTHDTAREFLLAAAAIGLIIKENASISGAEVGCQGEVGSASAMAAAGLAQIMGGSAAQVENAAEIALEHNLGLTCDPIGGLVQIPCIERNAIGAVKSINAARLACFGDGQHWVSLDDAVKTMSDTGKDMLSKYKETSMGGLAVNIGLKVNRVEC